MHATEAHGPRPGAKLMSPVDACVELAFDACVAMRKDRESLDSSRRALDWPRSASDHLSAVNGTFPWLSLRSPSACRLESETLHPGDQAFGFDFCSNASVFGDREHDIESVASPFLVTKEILEVLRGLDPLQPVRQLPWKA